MLSSDVVIFFALVHFFIVSASIAQPDSTAPLLEFNDVFDPSKDSQAAFMNMVTNYPNFVAEEWPHVLTWDLFVGRWIWLDGLKRGDRDDFYTMNMFTYWIIEAIPSLT